MKGVYKPNLYRLQVDDIKIRWTLLQFPNETFECQCSLSCTRKVDKHMNIYHQWTLSTLSLKIPIFTQKQQRRRLSRLKLAWQVGGLNTDEGALNCSIRSWLSLLLPRWELSLIFAKTEECNYFMNRYKLTLRLGITWKDRNEQLLESC